MLRTSDSSMSAKRFVVAALFRTELKVNRLRSFGDNKHAITVAKRRHFFHNRVLFSRRGNTAANRVSKIAKIQDLILAASFP